MEQDKAVKNNDGRQYELFVQEIQQAILNADQSVLQKNIKVQHNCLLTNIFGQKRQFDLYWEYELGGYTYKNIIECKDYENGVSIDKIDALMGKMRGFPGIKPIIATRVKFQSGAVEQLERYGIDAIIVREEEKQDWVSKDGTSLMRELHINLDFIMPIHIKDFRPKADVDWAKANNISTIRINAREDEIFLKHKESNTTESLRDYFERVIPRNTTEDTIENTYIENFTNTFLIANSKTIKLRSVEIDYIAPKVLSKKIKIAPSVKGVVEYLLNKQKKMVLMNGGDIIVKDMP